MGAPEKPVRMALGALIIKEKCGFADEETVEQSRENHYFQYFIGLPECRDEKSFDPSMMVHFLKRLGANILQEVNELICGANHDQTSRDQRMRDYASIFSDELGTQASLLLYQFFQDAVF